MMPAATGQTVPQQQEEGERRPIPIFGLGQQQRSPFISTVKRVNCVVEMTDNGRQQAAIIGLPGLQDFMDLGDTPCRALFTIDETPDFYVVIGDQIIKSSINQTPIVLGALPTDTGPVWIDSNGKELFINDGQIAYIYNLTTGILAQIVDADYPVLARGGTFLQGRFLVFTPPESGASAGRVYASDQLAGLSWDALNFFTPESLPDGIRGITRWFNDLVVFGHSSIEWWSGTPTPIPGALGFKPITGANTEIGLEAELGFAGVDQILYFVGHGHGHTGIYKIQGYSAIKISPPSIDDELAKRPTHFSAICTAYIAGGHPMFQLTIPSVHEDRAITIIYDSLTELWSFRSSTSRPYYRGLLSASNRDSIYITDAFIGKICKMVETEYTECDEPMIFEVTSIHLLNKGDVLTIDQIQIDMETGVGTASGQGESPRGMIQISKDGGRTWGDERWVNIGKTGDYRCRAARRRIGQSRDIAVRFRITDPIPRKVTGAYLILSAGLS